MKVFLIALSTVAMAEMGDRTQLLSLFLSAHFRKPWAITAGICIATLANHLLAGLVGVWFGQNLAHWTLDSMVGISMLAMAAWTLIPDKLDGDTKILDAGAFITTLFAFFVAEIGDKTQLATFALAAGYRNLPAIVAGSTAGILVANVPIIFLGSTFALRLPIKKIHHIAACVFALLGLYFIGKAMADWLRP